MLATPELPSKVYLPLLVAFSRWSSVEFTRVTMVALLCVDIGAPFCLNTDELSCRLYHLQSFLRKARHSLLNMVGRT